ncbi:YciI family protein [Streptomyces sp. NPDC051561]|uniref:YciI family protein n=1 Tax=Streptomyces sp. NPDC051561 TaxID=3365658 RepID=UPI0037A09F1E
MPQFVLLVHEDEVAWSSAEQAVRDRIVEQHYEFAEKHRDVLVHGNEFQSTAVSVDVRGGDVAPSPSLAPGVTVPCGYFVVEADDIDHAVRIAQRIPMEFGYVQVRPVQVWEPRDTPTE